MNSSRLEIAAAHWSELMTDLRRRGGGRRESGAFLLGTMNGNVRRVEAWAPYDDLDPNALTAGYVCLDTSAFTRLWATCGQAGKVIVADVHTHPGGPHQSLSDRANPMISQVGHLALIVPKYARGRVTPRDISVNVYLGGKQWASFFKREAHARVTLV